MESIRDTPLGQVLRAVGLKHSLCYPEEVPGFIPPHMGKLVSDSRDNSTSKSLPNTVMENGRLEKETESSLPVPVSAAMVENFNHSMLTQETGLPPANLESKTVASEAEIVVVDWYNHEDEDPANPRNWSALKKAWVTLIVW